MKFESTDIWGFQHAIRGMRNPMNSWQKSDSWFYELDKVGNLGPKDISLATNLIASGTEHRKFLRQIFVSVDITAPLYWWKEFDTYKVGTVANSTSTMHKLLSYPITLDCFETGDATDLPVDEHSSVGYFVEESLIGFLEKLRLKAVELYDGKQDELAKAYWKELIRWLPESWLQTRTVTMNYENIRSMYYQRQNHKLTEWREDFCNWVKSLPYSKEFLIETKGEDNGKQN